MKGTTPDHTALVCIGSKFLRCSQLLQLKLPVCRVDPAPVGIQDKLVLLH